MGNQMSGLDPVEIKIISALRAIPDPPLPGVSGQVMKRLAARQRRVAVLRWATAVGTACLAGLGINALGPGTWSYMYEVLLHGDGGMGGLGALAKIASILRDVLATLGLKFFQATIGLDLSPYAPEIWTSLLGVVVVVILMMYLMGRWLSKPKEGTSWLLRRSLHNGLQVM